MSEPKRPQDERVRGFLAWATSTRTMPRRLILARTTFTTGNAISQHERLTLLRQHLTADTLPLRERRPRV